MYIYIYVYIHLFREREREREYYSWVGWNTNMYTHIDIIYIYILQGIGGPGALNALKMMNRHCPSSPIRCGLWVDLRDLRDHRFWSSMKLSQLLVNVPIVGGLFHITKTNSHICWRWTIPNDSRVMWNIFRDINPNHPIIGGPMIDPYSFSLAKKQEL